MNYVTLVGRLVEEPTIEETESKQITKVKIAISRSYKNENGEYETDNIECILWNAMASSTNEYCHTGDVIGLKGRLQIINGKLEVIAEKVTFIESGRSNS